MNFGKRPGEELYNIKEDPDCIHNLAGDLKYVTLLSEMGQKMEEELKRENDPRMLGQGHLFDGYPYSEPERIRFYERFMAGEPMIANWIEKTDIESEPIQE